MHNHTEKHLFNARLLLIAVTTVILTVIALMTAHVCIDWMLQMRDVVDTTYR